jgi:hypothetical protein
MQKYQFIATDHFNNELYREVTNLPRLARLVWSYTLTKGTRVECYRL